jgi:nicotinamidase-related amidase
MSTSAKSKKRSKGVIALLLIDVVNHFEFPDGDRILRQALLIGQNIARLKARARTAGIPTIYVNDNFGDWRSERSVLLDHCLQPEAKGKEFVKLVQPDEEDYFILKPMHSAFYQTPLLQKLGTTELILTGLTSNSCITCTAHDANMRNLKLFVPYDCSVARTAIEHRKAMQHLCTMTKANVVTSHNLRLGKSLKKVWITRDKLRTTGK